MREDAARAVASLQDIDDFRLSLNESVRFLSGSTEKEASRD